MLQTVDVGRLSLSAYRGIAPEEILDQLRALGRDLKGARILHVNATPYVFGFLASGSLKGTSSPRSIAKPLATS